MQEKNKKVVDTLFHNQNTQIRKCIRDIDMGYDSFNPFSTLPGTHKPDINILVIGPPKSGKSSLIRTMHYALNGHLSCNVENRTVGNSCLQRYEIKGNKRLLVQGLTKIKQTDQKLGIFCYEVDFGIMGKQFYSPLNRYARVLQLINTKSLNCGGYSTSYKYPLNGINYVILCLSMVEKVGQEQILAMKTFLAELQQKRIKFTIVGTHLDLMIGRQSRTIKNSGLSVTSVQEQQKLQYVQQWKMSVLRQISPKMTSQTYCIQNYLNILPKSQNQLLKASQSINFYALNLLINCIKKAPQSEKVSKKKISRFLFCF